MGVYRKLDAYTAIEIDGVKHLCWRSEGFKDRYLEGKYFHSRAKVIVNTIAEQAERFNCQRDFPSANYCHYRCFVDVFDKLYDTELRAAGARRINNEPWDRDACAKAETQDKKWVMLKRIGIAWVFHHGISWERYGEARRFEETFRRTEKLHTKIVLSKKCAETLIWLNPEPVKTGKAQPKEFVVANSNSNCIPEAPVVYGTTSKCIAEEDFMFNAAMSCEQMKKIMSITPKWADLPGRIKLPSDWCPSWSSYNEKQPSKTASLIDQYRCAYPYTAKFWKNSSLKKNVYVDFESLLNEVAKDKWGIDFETFSVDHGKPGGDHTSVCRSWYHETGEIHVESIDNLEIRRDGMNGETKSENRKFFTTVTKRFVNGRDIDSTTAHDLCDSIANEEGVIRRLEAREFKTKALIREIVERKINVQELVDYLDTLDTLEPEAAK